MESSSTRDTNGSNGEGVVFCDECTEQKLKAVKSCLVCLASYCEEHLKPHLTSAGLKRHQLLDPVEDLEARICSEHNKPFELFCRTDQRTVCMFCVLFDHKNHDYIPVNVEAGQKKFELRETEVTLNQMIQERRAKMEGLRHTSKLNKESADRQAAAGLQVFVDLKQIFENGLDQLSKNIEISQTKVEQLTQNFIAELGLEVKVLMQSSANVYQLLLSNDHVHVLQTFTSVNRVPAVKDWSGVSVPLPLYEEMVRKVVVKTVGQLQTLFRKPKMKPHEAELQRRQSCSSTSRTSTLTSNEHFFSLGKLERNIISRSSQMQHQATRVVDILCDECTGQKLKAVKSCLVCLTSYCEMHLKPHLTAAGLKRHQLLDPVENLEARICSEHNKPFELFCRTDHKTVCMFCILFNHKEHNYVPLSQEFELKRSELRETEGVLKQMIQDRRAKLLDLRHTSKLNKEAAERQAAAALQVIEDLKKILDQGLDELCKKIEMSKTEKEELTQGLIAQLEKEIRVLMQSSSDVQQLSVSEDDIHVLQTVFSVNIIPTLKNWSAVSVQLPSYEGMVKKAVESAEKKIQNTFGEAKINLLEAEIQRAQGFKVNLTLDPQTADPWLILSKDCKQVRLGDIKKALPGGPKRFNPGGGIVAKESFCSGRFFFEVQVTGMLRYDLGVVNESINRMNKITKSQEIGHWLLSLRRGREYKARASYDIPLCVTLSPQRIGLLVDYDEGLVCFYGLDSKDLIYSFNGCRFTERLYPFFNPGKGSSSSASLKIS